MAYQKVIVSNHVIEVYTMQVEPQPPQKNVDDHEPYYLIPPLLETVVQCPYSNQELRFKFENPDFREYLENEKHRIKIDMERRADRKKERRSQTLRDTRNRIRRLCITNFDHESRFITLTFADNQTDVIQANKEYNKFIKRMRRRYGDFKYITVIEFQERGAVHYHMISDLPYIDNDKLYQLWGHGWVRINLIDHVDNVGAYITKYMTKELDDQRLQGKKSYLTSKGLEKPKVYKGIEAQALIKAMKLENKKTQYANSYESEYCGVITYNEYNLKR